MRKEVVGGIVALAVVMGTSALLAGGHQNKPKPDDYDAYKACENWVKDRLKAPSTADFSGHNGSSITSTTDGYNIAGYVDSQNSFGAQIRSDWTCNVELTGDQWTLHGLDIR